MQYVNNPLGSAALAAAIRAITNSTITGTVATVLAWGAGILQSRQEAWWKDSAIMILRGRIRGVKSTVTSNRTGDYPKVYRTLERY